MGGYVGAGKQPIALFDAYTKGQADGLFPDKTSVTPQDFTAMPSVGGDPIVESGSNADGAWTRWADGTQIATAVVSVNFNGDVDLASRRIFNPPVSFIYNKSEIDGAVVSSASVTDMNAFGRDFANGLLQSFELGGSNPGDWVLATMDANSADAGANLVSLSAIGRWK